MRPLLLLITVIVATSYGKPGGSYSYPAPTPSPDPGLFSNLEAVFNLQTSSGSVAPQVFLPSPNEPPPPSEFNYRAGSISPSLLVENIVGAGQYGPPAHIGDQPPSGESSNEETQPPISFPLVNHHTFDFPQSGLNLGGELLPVGSPILPAEPRHPFSYPEFPQTPHRFTSAHFHVEPKDEEPSVREIEILKHIYVHVPPEEPEKKPPRKSIVLPPLRRHYKIIFIKAPSPPEPTAPEIPPPVQDEERTLVYVLVKKAEEEPEVNIPSSPRIKPSKPEVYFIKYNTRKEVTAGEDDPSEPAIDSRIGGKKDDKDKEEKEDKVEKGEEKEEKEEEDSDTTAPTVRIGDSGSNFNTNVNLNLNKASLSGGSALSLAITDAPQEATLHVSSTPPLKAKEKFVLI